MLLSQIRVRVKNVTRKVDLSSPQLRREVWRLETSITMVGGCSRCRERWGARAVRNNAGKTDNWLGVILAGKKSNPDAIGARSLIRLEI